MGETHYTLINTASCLHFFYFIEDGKYYVDVEDTLWATGMRYDLTIN